MTTVAVNRCCKKCAETEQRCAYLQGCCPACTHWPDVKPAALPVAPAVVGPSLLPKRKPADRHCGCGGTETECAPNWPCCLQCETWWLLQTEAARPAPALPVAPPKPKRRRRGPLTALERLELELLPCARLPAVDYGLGPTAQWALAEQHRLLWQLAAESDDPVPVSLPVDGAA